MEHKGSNAEEDQDNALATASTKVQASHPVAICVRPTHRKMTGLLPDGTAIIRVWSAFHTAHAYILKTHTY